nr:hypothetical protein [Oscillatoria laete-virens]
MARDSAESKTNLNIDLLYPLDEVYRAVGLLIPNVEEITGANMPEPYRSLLVHQGDMTPALEGFHGARIHLNVLNAWKRTAPQSYLREVVLKLDGSEQPVEYGAILIHLEQFSVGAQRDILEGRKPLGTVMREQNVVHLSRPRAYLQVDADAHIAEILNAAPGQTLCGRRNRLLTSEGGLLADIVEILPPARGDSKFRT